MGTIVISIDAELAWGFHDHEKLPVQRIDRARGAWLKLIDLLDEFEVSATWAVVCHLFLNECDGVHADIECQDGWFARDPGGTVDESTSWFAPDLIETICDASVNHEIGSHTFSHVEFGNQATTQEIAAADLRECRRMASKWDIELESFVFPRNNVGNRELLAKYDFTCYRGVEPERWYDRTPIRPIGKAISMTAGRSPPPTVQPDVDEYGLVNIPASLYLFSFEGLPKQLIEKATTDPIVKKAKLGIDAVIDSDRVFHVWLHPNNISNKEDIERMRKILAYIDQKRGMTGLNVQTMGQLARQALAMHPANGS
jgi:peptidoglycan/xylan/chitin deacetylase (PgdA/CDA1 family)